MIFQFAIVDILTFSYSGNAELQQLYKQPRFCKVSKITRFNFGFGNHNGIRWTYNSLIIGVLYPTLKRTQTNNEVSHFDQF